jgi:hypothetical protein
MPGYAEALGSTQCRAVAHCPQDRRLFLAVVVPALLLVGVLQLVVVSGVWVGVKSAPSGRVKLLIYFAQVGGGV